MALEVQPTPTLSGDVAVEFLKKLAKGESRPVKRVETPKLSKLLERLPSESGSKRDLSR